MGIVYRILFAGYFAKKGSKRVVGGFNSFCMMMLIPQIGIFIILSSRRLDDEQKDLALIKKFKPVEISKLLSD
jgi:hypothetical protein